MQSLMKVLNRKKFDQNWKVLEEEFDPKDPCSPNSFIQGPNKDLIKDTSEIGCFELFFNKAIL